MITIVHAYADLMNLYGDYANIKALRRRLESAGHEAEIKKVSAGDAFDFSECDLFYIGAGTEPAMFAALNDIEKNGAAIKKYAETGGKILATGNAAALFARSITAEGKEPISGLALCDCDVAVTKKRSYAEYIMTTPLIGQLVVGSVNASIEVSESATPMFAVSWCTAKGSKSSEGYHSGGLYMTGLGGPLLVRNPALLDYFAALLCGGELPPCGEAWYKYLDAGSNSILQKLKDAGGCG